MPIIINGWPKSTLSSLSNRSWPVVIICASSNSSQPTNRPLPSKIGLAGIQADFPLFLQLSARDLHCPSLWSTPCVLHVMPFKFFDGLSVGWVDFLVLIILLVGVS